MKTSKFNFHSDSIVMPTDPVEFRAGDRTTGRMIVLDRKSESIHHRSFRDIEDYFRPGDLLVLNDSYMLSNTLALAAGDIAASVIIYGSERDGTWMAEIRPRHLAQVGQRLQMRDAPELACVLMAQRDDDLWQVRFEPAELLMPALDRHGSRSDATIPLDPAGWKERPQAYRSVYAKTPGSLEIPSAGLHFSAEMLRRIADKGVEIAYVTLHVGATEILAVRHIAADDVEDHRVREEFFQVDAEAADKLSRALREQRRIFAVGTTVVRTLESLTVRDDATPAVLPQSGWTGLYIFPGFKFKLVDALLTNLHRPRSSHLVLTGAFAGSDLLMRSYDALLSDGGYEFDMFGDSMLIV